jgi:hypothetical protein
MDVLMLCKGFEKQQVPGYPQVFEICRALKLLATSGVSLCGEGAWRDC